MRQTGLPIHVISVAHCCPLVLIEDITLMSQDACHIWNYYIIKCYKMLVIFTNYDRHYVIFTNMRQYCYSPGWWLPTFAIIPPADDCLLLLLFPWLMTAYFCYYSPGWWLPTFAIIPPADDCLLLQLFPADDCLLLLLFPRLMTAYFCYYSPCWWLPTFALPAMNKGDYRQRIQLWTGL